MQVIQIYSTIIIIIIIIYIIIIITCLSVEYKLLTDLVTSIKLQKYHLSPKTWIKDIRFKMLIFSQAPQLECVEKVKINTCEM